MADFNFGNAFAGAASGAGAGAVAGPWGALAGGIGGFLGGGFLSPGKGPNLSPLQDLINKRQAQIDAFGKQLDTARNNILGNFQNLQSTTMARFLPQLEANLAGRGLPASSGAFASGAGMEAANLQGQYDTLNTNLTENNLQQVQNLEAGLFSPSFGVAESSAMIPFQLGQQGQAGRNQFISGAIGSAGNLVKALQGLNIFGSSTPSASYNWAGGGSPSMANVPFDENNPINLSMFGVK